MELDASTLARRLREAREASGLRQEDVARHLELSRSSVAQLELGNRAVSGIELARLGYLYGRDIRDFLAVDFNAEEAVLALFRATPEFTGQEEALAAIREGLHLSRELAHLEGLLGVDRAQLGAPVYPREVPRTRWQAIEQGNRVAAEERQRLGLGGRPLGEAIDLLEEQGIRTAMLDLPEEVSGLTLMERGRSLSILVNRAHHWLRRRFSWVHEYAHILLDRNQQATISLAARRDDFAEVRANAFAASFLVPEDGVRSFLEDLGRGPAGRERVEIFDEVGTVRAELRPEPGAQAIRLYEIVLLAHHFRVSRTAAIYRLDNLHRLAPGARDALLAEDRSGQGRRIEKLLRLPQPDHGATREEFRLRFLGLAFEAYRRDKISRGKLRELAHLVSLGDEDLQELLGGAGLADEEHEPQIPEGVE